MGSARSGSVEAPCATYEALTMYIVVPGAKASSAEYPVPIVTRSFTHVYVHYFQHRCRG